MIFVVYDEALVLEHLFGLREVAERVFVAVGQLLEVFRPLRVKKG